MDSNTNNLQQLWQIYTDWLSKYISNQYQQLNGLATDKDYAAFKEATGYDFLLSDDASFITGQIIAVDGGFTLK